MPKERAGYEPYAWWLTREQIGLCLRKDYRVPKNCRHAYSRWSGNWKQPTPLKIVNARKRRLRV
jgi:hypothetical protein